MQRLLLVSQQSDSSVDSLELLAYCLYPVWEGEVDVQGVVLGESREVSGEDHPGHVALRLAVIQSSVLPLHVVSGCTQIRLVKPSRGSQETHGRIEVTQKAGLHVPCCDRGRGPFPSR